MGMIREAALTQKVWLVPGWTAGDDEWSRHHHHLFAFLRQSGRTGAGCQWVEFGFASGLLGSCGAQRWRLAEPRVVGGDGLIPRQAARPGYCTPADA